MGTPLKTYDQLIKDVQALQKRVNELEAAQEGKNENLMDALTGLMNENGLALLGGKEVARARRYGHPLSLILVDLDGFAGFNDRYGRESGDLILTRLAAVFGEQIRHPDFLFRTGGDEFTVMLPETDLKKGEAFAGRLLQTIAGIKIPILSGTASITACAGVATLVFVEAKLEILLSHAQTALKTAKAQGPGSFAGYQG